MKNHEAFTYHCLLVCKDKKVAGMIMLPVQTGTTAVLLAVTIAVGSMRSSGGGVGGGEGRGSGGGERSGLRPRR